MKIDQLVYSCGKFVGEVNLSKKAQWVLVFGNKKLICDNDIFNKLRDLYPSAYIMGCSTAGEIQGNIVTDDALNVTAVFLEKSNIVFDKFDLGDGSNAYQIGEMIISKINKEELKHIFVLSEGININGSKLVEGLRNGIMNKVPVTGGLAGDGSDFTSTYLIANNYAMSNQIVIASLYGDIKSGCASFGGWDTFGIERLVTKSKENILFEIDGKPALDLYKEYLGDLAQKLPASGLLFPLNIREKNADNSYVRTILGIDEKNKSLIFAGDIPTNSYCRLMKSNSYNIIQGAKTAAELSVDMLQAKKVELAILISCVGRKLVLKQVTEDEVEASIEVIGKGAYITGFYSYGEIAPYKQDTSCELHNQTMTITLLTEE